MTYHIKEKYYSKEDNLFHVIRYKDFIFETEDKSFDTFEKFYRFLKHDLKDANLLDYDFEGIDLKKYDFTKAKISSQTMIKLGTYNNKFFNLTLKDDYLLNITPSKSLDLVTSRNLDNINIENDESVIYYISDLHLNHKLKNKFSDKINKYELESYFESIVEQLQDSIHKTSNFGLEKNIIFVGDISFNFEVFKIFFKTYRKIIPYRKTFVILGNHELWDIKLNRACKSVEEIVEKYRVFLSSLESEIYLLENQLYFPNDKKRIYSEQEILAMDNRTLRKKFIYNPYAIFGAIGYAGLNEDFNYNNGIYRGCPITRPQEQERSEIVNKIHAKLSEIAFDKKIFFVTHMPKKDWSNCDYNKNWIYISGHTHKNYYVESEEKTIYSDNQVGYEKELFEFKPIFTSRNYDIFQDHKDGIYEINKQKYLLFNYGLGIRLDFRRNPQKIFMIKKNGVYMFFSKMTENSDLKLLNGGILSNIGKHDLNYFYENLNNYSNSIKLFFESYDNFQKAVSQEIKKIGGDGTIHGCIVDIDFLNHLYINPFDGKITPYYATSIVEKFVYENLISLLKEKNKELYFNYNKLLGLNNEKSLVLLNKDLIESDKKTLVESTDIYRVSKIIKKFQYTTKYNVVRVWNDTIVGEASVDKGKLIVSGIVNPEEMKALQKEQRRIERENQKKLKPLKIKIPKPIITKEEKQKILFDKYCEKLSHLNVNVKVLDYKTASEKAYYECLTCGHKWRTRPDHLLRTNKKIACPECRKNMSYIE